MFTIPKRPFIFSIYLTCIKETDLLPSSHIFTSSEENNGNSLKIKNTNKKVKGAT
jgi:hypothetical protein